MTQYIIDIMLHRIAQCIAQLIFSIALPRMQKLFPPELGLAFPLTLLLLNDWNNSYMHF